MRRPTLWLSSLVCLAACASRPPLPEGSGPGVVAFDPAPPEGARTWNAPKWSTGDRFVLLRGGGQRIEFSVAAIDERGYVLTGVDGVRMRRGLDLSNLGEWPADGSEEGLHVLSPADTRFHWPLWVGKRWRCRYADRTAGGPSLPIETAYEVEDFDTVSTPAGTFPALRILRTSRLQAEGAQFLDRVSVIWYSPDLGVEVRQTHGETAVELLEWTRDGVSGGQKEAPAAESPAK